jgi:hypothetical protein
MKLLFRILAFLFLYILLCSDGCGGDEGNSESREQAGIEKTQDSIRTAFTADTLPPASLKAFEGMAQQKFSDFTGYLILLGNNSVAPSFKEKTREMIRDLFISESSVLQFSKPVLQGKKELEVSMLTKPGSDFAGIFGSIPADSVRIAQSLQQINDSLYAGKLYFPMIPVGMDSSKASTRSFNTGSVSFIITRCKKGFGKDTLRVWSVFLGR